MKDERVYLGHIRDAINDIEQYATGRDTFMAVLIAILPSTAQRPRA